MELTEAIERIMSKVDGVGPDKIKELYLNDCEFKDDMDFVEKRIREIFEPVAKAAIDAIASIIASVRADLLKLSDEQRALLASKDMLAKLDIPQVAPNISFYGGRGSMKGATMKDATN
ncbi:hypothetical protein HCC36_10960 [Listeria booriae]|uniref:Uncharacterized protein n=1 Tax=Listeria booriae TaxID=1552123 RepID=A0A842FT51_9LIST|nr:hypothetical protein [Listeria booriae]MBC2293748.1 hypothetical protein [Listeria booriae]